MSVQVLNRALDLIELLATSENGLSIAELSMSTGLPKSTIHRILSSYTERHYVEKDEETSIYSLGYKFVEIASVYLNKIVLKTEAMPIMHELASTFEATSYLGVLESNEVMYLEKVEQFNNLRLYTQIGKREPLHCTGLGKVLMAFLPDEQFEHIAKQLEYTPLTPNTITNYDDYKKAVQIVRKNGYAIDHGEHVITTDCLAVPIYDYTGTVMAAMSISGRNLFESHPVQQLLGPMLDASSQLSQRMGYTKQ
ncbi:IclR family transcriptional regulator [Lacrimispora sp. NSJ-141]|uniref:Glycerol operon regulatory protein n=1 Tax=Lientehia hominis TaxID=2897778 RepID=A0AAP2RKY2_9FIRM|nr:IclR family transcriptional regulator [Lientehia hominis]MCD2493671.1 IclR family transcriptional regulator [Lientehia hominis]